MEKNKILRIDSNIEIENYTQSANALFHFMAQKVFLESALREKALFPRYCKEDISYLDISVNGDTFSEIAVLQKCFCDIPLHKLATNFDLKMTPESNKKIKPSDRQRVFEDNNHPGYYGRYAIAFSKQWCASRNLQPIHYLNKDSTYTRDFKELVKTALTENILSDDFVSDILQRLALIKPLQGKMKRQVQLKNESVELELEKNFHDEQEWRYIPDHKTIEQIGVSERHTIEPIIANPNLLSLRLGPGESYLDSQSKIMQTSPFSKLWLHFSYSDIRYLIVPDNQARIDIIDYILSLPGDRFDDPETELLDRHILISKILLLDEIRKDW